MITFQREKADTLIEEIKPLLDLHWNEISHYPDIPLDPDYEKYIEIEKTGTLRCFTVRLDNKLIGYVIYFVCENLHYKSSLQAVQDILFIQPDQRGILLGMKLLKFANDELRNEGVQVDYQHIKAKHNFGPMLERLGYELVDLIYAKRLD